MRSSTRAKSAVSFASRSRPASAAKRSMRAAASSSGSRRCASSAASAATAASPRHAPAASISGPSHICAAVSSPTLRWMQGQSPSTAARAPGRKDQEGREAAEAASEPSASPQASRPRNASSRRGRAAPPAHQPLRGIIGVKGKAEEQRRHRRDDAERGPIELPVEGEADQLDRVGEGVEPADLVEQRARLRGCARADRAPRRQRTSGRSRSS